MQALFLFQFRYDSQHTVSKKTWKQVAKKIGMSEVAAIQLAMAKLAGETIKAFPFERIGKLDLSQNVPPGNNIRKLDESYFEVTMKAKGDDFSY